MLHPSKADPDARVHGPAGVRIRVGDDTPGAFRALIIEHGNHNVDSAAPGVWDPPSLYSFRPIGSSEIKEQQKGRKNTGRGRALTKVRGHLLGFSITRSISLAAELGIADRLANGPRTAGELGRECGSDPESTGMFYACALIFAI
jgi:hypothetical protein